jgi:hypothetical protein
MIYRRVRLLGLTHIYGHFFHVTVFGWALWFRRIQVCQAMDMILSLNKSAFEKCSCFCYTHRLIFTDSCNTPWAQFNCRARRNACLLVLTVAKSVHAVCLIFISCFWRMIFKMPHANCTAVQIGLCRLGEGWTDSRVCDSLVFLHDSAWNILVRG